jgi:hypothetical protein
MGILSGGMRPLQHHTLAGLDLCAGAKKSMVISEWREPSDAVQQARKRDCQYAWLDWFREMFLKPRFKGP